MLKKLHHKVVKKVKTDNEQGARRAVLEDLFYDFHRSRVQVYRMNFVRGLFFGFGSVLGGTVLIALLAWILSLFVTIPGIGDTAHQVQETIQAQKK